MSESSPRLEHGGSIAQARLRWEEPKEGWLDLSTGINPLAYPVENRLETAWRRLPDETDLERLIDAARCYYGAPAACGIVAAAGSQALISTLPFVLEPRRVAILGFTYGEHAHSWRLARHDVCITTDLTAALDADVVVVTNPNNPDGRVLQPQMLLELLQVLQQKNGLLVVDEAFGDLMPELSLAFATGSPGLLVFRSFGKFFGLAGLRLGFALGETELIQRLSDILGPWSVSGPALHIGRCALRDDLWITQTRTWLRHSSRTLERLLQKAGLEILGGTDLFTLAYCADSEAMTESLGRQGILVRRFSERPGWLRFGLPPDDSAYERLAAAMMAATIGRAGNADT